jgi:paraquat-inducible protein B
MLWSTAGEQASQKQTTMGGHTGGSSLKRARGEAVREDLAAPPLASQLLAAQQGIARLQRMVREQDQLSEQKDSCDKLAAMLLAVIECLGEQLGARMQQQHLDKVVQQNNKLSEQWDTIIGQKVVLSEQRDKDIEQKDKVIKAQDKVIKAQDKVIEAEIDIAAAL